MTRLRLTPLLLSLAALAAAAVTGLPAGAQTHKVEEPDNVIRAVAVYEWTGPLDKPTASRLVPVSLYINGSFQEAGVYLARPVPFVLDSGFAYELDDAGVLRGTFDTLSAGRLSGGNDSFDDPWVGNGRFVPPAAPPKVAALRTIKNPAIVSNKTLSDPDRPQLVNKSPAPDTPDAKPAGSSTTPVHPSPDPSTVGTGATPPSTSTPDSSDNKNDVDRPTLRRPAPLTKEQQKQADAARKKASRSSVSGPDTPLNDDPDRPTLRRHGSGSGEAGPAELMGLPADMHQLTAVSDAASRPEHNFARPWQDDNERTAILRQLQTMARAQLAAYDKLNPLPISADTTTVVHNGPVSTATPSTIATPDNGPPKLQRGIPKGQTTTAASSATASAPASSTQTSTPATTAKSSIAATARPLTPAARRRAAAAAKAAAAKAAAAPPLPLPLLDEQLRAYELSYEADPTFVYTAHTAGAGAGERFITLVAQQDPFTHQLQLPIHSVTDAAHFDRSPQMRPVDAVDADASNRASLLMELRNQSSRQFALYRVMSGHAERIFLSGTTQ